MTTTVCIFICIYLVFAFCPYLSVPSVINTLRIRELHFDICGISGLAKAWYESPDHIISREIYNCNVPFLNLVREEEITNVQCSGPLPRAFLAICFQQIALLLSWYNMLLLILYPYSSRNSFSQRILTDPSCTPTKCSAFASLRSIVPYHRHLHMT
jgi:hypothetical protein